MVLYLSAHMGISFCPRDPTRYGEVLCFVERSSTRTFGTDWLVDCADAGCRIDRCCLGGGRISGFCTRCIWSVVTPKTIWKDIWYQSSPQKDLTKEIFAVVMCNFFLNYLLSVDIIIGGEKLGDAGGAYVTANKFGKLLYFVGASIAIVVLPWFSRRSMTQDTKKQLFVGMLMFIPATMVLSPLSAIILDPFIRFMFPLDIVPTFCIIVVDVNGKLCPLCHSVVCDVAHCSTDTGSKLGSGNLLYCFHAVIYLLWTR